MALRRSDVSFICHKAAFTCEIDHTLDEHRSRSLALSCLISWPDQHQRMTVSRRMRHHGGGSVARGDVFDHDRLARLITEWLTPQQWQGDAENGGGELP